jgi:hypothetical protein
MEGGEPGPDRRQQAARPGLVLMAGLPPREAPRHASQQVLQQPRVNNISNPWQQQLPRLDRLSQPVMIVAAVSPN